MRYAICDIQYSTFDINQPQADSPCPLPLATLTLSFMKILFAGTGTSSGVPMIACDCDVCCSDDPLNRRMRASVYLEVEGQCIVIDTPPDFREQCLTHNLRHVDAVVFTHAHADHILGFDDIRRFNTVQKSRIPAYAASGPMEDLHRIFDYIIGNEEIGVYRPKIDFCEVSCEFRIGDVVVTEFGVKHGPKPTSGFLFEGDGVRFGYVPDCLEMGDDVVELLKGVDVMVLDALRYNPHPTHLTVDNSVKLLERIGAKQSYLTHLGHDLEHKTLAQALPDGIQPAYDGLCVSI